eukprot:s999_g18.t2
MELDKEDAFLQMCATNPLSPDLSSMAPYPSSTASWFKPLKKPPPSSTRRGSGAMPAMPRRCRQPLALAAGSCIAAVTFTVPSAGPLSARLVEAPSSAPLGPEPRMTSAPSGSVASVAALAGLAGLASTRKMKTSRHFFGEPEKTVTTTETLEVHQKGTQHPPGARIPEGTPEPHPMTIRKRPRRNRRSAAQRDMFAETRLTASNFILPIFGTEDIPISSMPGVCRRGVDTGLLKEVEEAVQLGVKSVVLFPKTPDELKTQTAEECFNPEGLAQRAIRNVKQAFPDVVALRLFEH